MKQNKSISLPKKGMNRDANPSQLQNIEYSLGVNVNTTNEVGDELNIQNEPSNYYGVKFPDTYKVIGFKKDNLTERTYYFLTSTTTDEESEDYKRSSIGYVDDTVLETYNQDSVFEGCSDCNSSNVLDTPLENITQTPSQVYVELLHDRCIDLVDLEDKGLNFNINFPLKKIEINQEKLGTALYWNDYRNYPRFLNVTDVEEKGANSYVFEVIEPCEDNTYQDCINVDKLRIFPKHNRIWVEASELQTGGNLKLGTYEFWVSYCDLMGNEMTQYSTPTNPISIWDENNNIQSQVETDEFTNYAIKLKIHNLDTENFRYYKVAVVERNNVNATQSVFLAGIYPTTDDTVLYTHSGSTNDDIYIARGNVSLKKRMDFSTLTAIKPEWEKAKGTMVSGDTLWQYGLVQKEELNLQPVFNLFGSLLHAQTSAVSENLYKSAIATSKYKAYPRNEVIPFSVRLLYKDGGYSSNFPLISRPLLANEDAVLTETDINYKSLVDNTSCVTTERNKKWQVYNTAIPYEALCTNIEDNATTTTDDITKTCTVEGVTTVAGGTIEITPTEEYYDLSTYLNENPSTIPAVESALNATYPGQDCEVTFYGDCTVPTLSTEEPEKNVVGEVENEQSETIYEEDVNNYIKSIPPSSLVCNIYKKDFENNYVVDTSMTPYIPCGNEVYVRNSDFYNEDCGYSEEVLNITNPAQFNGSLVFLNYDKSYIESDLIQTGYDVEPTTITTDFRNKLHTKAQFFKISKDNRDKLIFEITKKSTCDSKDDLQTSSSIRYTIYNTCSGSISVLGGGIVDLDTGELILIDVTTFPDDFYIALDAPIKETFVQASCPSTNITAPDFTIATLPIPAIYDVDGTTVLAEDTGDVYTYTAISDSWDVTHKRSYIITPPCSCFSIYTRDITIKNITITYDGIRIDKVQTYQATCTFSIPRVNDCDPIPYRKYTTAYWESTETYDDNKELWDSSNIKISPSNLGELSLKDKKEFLDYYVEGGSLTPEIDIQGNYVLKNVDFRCQPIRHFKMPDNSVAPYIIDNLAFKDNADSIIFPLGIELDSATVRTAIEIAYLNNLITKKQRDNIEGFEILRGDNSVSKSVIANGIAFDMYKYVKENDTIHFSNFPFNDLGQNKFLTETKFGNTLVSHPNNSLNNHLFSFISPDLFLNRPSIPTEAVLQGYVVGATKQEFVASDEHSEWTVLGDKATRTAEQLAIAEVALEALIKTNELLVTASQGYWFMAGFANGTGSAGAVVGTISAIVAGAAIIADGFMKVGRYRYEWLKVFRDLGRTYNLASMQVGVANYNKMIAPEQYSNDYLRKIASKKYIKDGYHAIIDENTGDEIKVNNKLREDSVFISTNKNTPFTYNTEYTTIDNNKKNSKSSNFVASEVGCVENKEFNRSVASPYFSLKNYIPDQWGTIDSIKWLTTNNIFKLNDITACTPMFGGTHVISRFSWRRKAPIFRRNAIKHPDKQPFMYSRYDNVAYPRFYCDYELTDGDNMWTRAGLPFPDISSNFNFDCESGRNRMYVKHPSKIYTSVHGIVDFLVESEINCNFRYARKEKRDWFYPQAQDLGNWLQEATLPMSEPNSFFYNNSYSFPVSNSPFKKLDKTYSKEVWSKRVNQPNAVTWSQKEVNENDLTNPWRVYKPLDWYEFKTNNGGLIDLHNIESNQFLARFENSLKLHNAIDNIAERVTPQNKELGTGGMFYQRPLEFKSTDLGFAGTQNTEILSTPYGHFWVDAKRGRVFQVDQNGGNLEPISETVGGKPTNMKQWFREHLPFKILKYYPNVDIDNKYKGLGVNMWYDDRNSRVFITKRDYIPTKTDCLKYDQEVGFYEQCQDNCEETGADIVFIVDATGTQQHAIDDIKNGIQSTIIPALESRFGSNHRMALIAVKDRRRVGENLFDILTPFSFANGGDVESQLNNLVANGGGSISEPTDLAILASLNNTTEIDKTGASTSSNTIGAFREDSSKAIFVFTDITPSGLDDNYTFEDWQTVQSITALAIDKNVQIFTHLTSFANPAPIPPTGSVPPNMSYIMNYYAENTNGVFNFNSLGTGITDDIVDSVSNNLECQDGYTLINFDNEEYFKDVSWTISYKPTEGSWNSYFTFYPDYSPYHQEYFQVGYNWGNHKETMWNHLLHNKSFCVFQGEYNPWIIEFPVTNQNVNKILNSLSINIESKRYINEWDYSVHKDIGVTDMFIYNTTNNTGYLVLNPQKTLTDNRNYPKTEGNKQHVITTFEEGKQNVNYFFNRMVNQNNNVPMFKKDENNIFKEIDPRAVRFNGKKVLERIKGEVFIVNLSNTQDSRFNILIKNIINNETLYE